ncbi:ABC transporter permease [Streptomyces klenkii]|uniref:ABC transporter permease n=1 Tax=Streptomyces klenkii TaxID=1420899 RepID=UPI0034167652
MMFRPNGLARAAIRFKPASFVGTFVALMMTALITSACGILLETGLRASAPAQRYAQAPVVAAADATVKTTDLARLDASLVGKAAAVPGAAKAIADVTFPVKAGQSALTAQGWASTAFTGTALATGKAPSRGEAVLSEGAAKAAHARVGQRIGLATAEGTQQFRVSGIAADGQPAVWFSDAQVGQLSGHPGKIDAIAVLAKPGTSVGELSGQVAKALEGTAKIHTGDSRATVENPSLPRSKTMLIMMGGSFGGTATMAAVFTAAATVALSVSQRAREFALLRAIGATPRQIRKSIAAEALLVAPIASALGCLPGAALATWWFHQLKDRGAIAPGVEFSSYPFALLGTVVIGILTALMAGYMAARRPAKIKPGQALSEASVEPARLGIIRLVLGTLATAGGGAMAIMAATTSGQQAAQSATGVVMLLMLAVGLLGPMIARAVTALFSLPMRAAGASASLAAANSRSNARRLASAITPIVLAMAFSSTLVFMHTSQEKAIEGQQREGIVADHIITAPAGLPASATQQAQASPGVTAAVGVLRSAVMVPKADAEVGFPTQGVSGTGAQLAAVQDLDVKTGNLSALGPGKVAIGTSLAEFAKVKVGDRLEMRLPDGTPSSPEVVATYSRSLGLADVTLPRATLAGHVTSAFDANILVRGGDASALKAVGSVTDSAGYAAAQNVDRELQTWANTTMAAVLGGFAAVAAANTLVMTVLDRRRELGTLRLIGSTRRQVLRMVRCETLLVTAAGVGLGSAIAALTLIPLMRVITGEMPHVPPVLYASFAGAVLVLGLVSTGMPARAALRTSALSAGSQKA